MVAELARQLLVAVSALMLLTACSTYGPDGPDTSPSTAQEEPDTWAMTGLAVPEGRSLRPVLTAKVDNTTGGRPQMGIDDADLVVQESVEGGATRLAAFYEAKHPRLVGPIRSIRTSDVGVVKPPEAILIASGGAPIALDAMAKARVTVVTEGSPGFVRDPSRKAPYNLLANLAEVSNSTDGREPQKPYLAFGSFDTPNGVRARRVDVTFSSTSSETWTYDKKSDEWRRQDRSSGGAFSAKNLIMLRVKLRDAGYKDPAGNFVPEVMTTGSGKGWLAVGQQVRRVLWSKKSTRASWELTTTSGSRIELPPGKSWISLLPKSPGGIDHS